MVTLVIHLKYIYFLMNVIPYNIHIMTYLIFWIPLDLTVFI